MSPISRATAGGRALPLSFLILLSGICYLISAPSTAQAGGLQNPQNNLGLVGYWNFEDATGTIATDMSGNRNTGTLNGSPVWANGKFTKALSFDGSSDYVGISDNSSLDITGQVTLSAWIKSSSFAANNQGIIGKAGWDIAPSGKGWELVSLNTSKIEFIYQRTTLDTNMTLSANTWYHLVAVRDANNMRIYINGSEDNSTARGTDTASSAGYDLNIGRRDPGNSPASKFNGLIDDVRIYNRALSASEVSALYQGRQTTRNAANNTGLIGHWNFEDATGTKATDFSGKSGAGTLVGDTSWAGGKLGKALSFDGTGDYVSIPNSSTTQFASGDFTISAWLYPRAYTSYNTPFAKGTASVRELTIHIPSETQFFLHAGETNTGTIGLSTGFSLGSWQHMTVVRFGSTATVYRNGVSVASAGSVGGTMVTDQPLSIGGNDPAGNVAWIGLIDDVRTYNRALSAAEVATLYGVKQQRVNAPNNRGLVGYWSFEDATGTKVTDMSGKGNAGTLTNGPTWTDGKFGKAITFNGSSQYVSLSQTSNLPIFSPTNPYSIAMWVKGPRSQGYTTLYGEGDTTSSTPSFSIRTGPENGKIEVIQNGSGGYHSATTVFDNTWHHIAWVDVAGTAKMYIDGAQDATSFGYFPSAATYNTSVIAALSSITPGGFFNGSIDDVRIYNRALSAEEVANLYAVGR